jgi:hypothetical protein
MQVIIFFIEGGTGAGYFPGKKTGNGEYGGY